MAQAIDMILPMLREMRAESEARHGEVLARFDRVEHRLMKLEDAQSSFKQALTADSLLSRLVTGEFEERIEALENRVRELEAQR
jgi:polyhydroxyalkanoate synthesis regulator phasin